MVPVDCECGPRKSTELLLAASTAGRSRPRPAARVPATVSRIRVGAVRPVQQRARTHDGSVRTAVCSARLCAGARRTGPVRTAAPTRRSRRRFAPRLPPPQGPLNFLSVSQRPARIDGGRAQRGHPAGERRHRGRVLLSRTLGSVPFYGTGCVLRYFRRHGRLDEIDATGMLRGQRLHALGSTPAGSHRRGACPGAWPDRAGGAWLRGGWEDVRLQIRSTWRALRSIASHCSNRRPEPKPRTAVRVQFDSGAGGSRTRVRE